MVFGFTLLHESGQAARAGVLHTRRGEIATPVFMPVATHAGFRHISMDDARSTGAAIILSNTYHLLDAPGPEVFRSFAGIHRFMGWQGAVLTDSGGYQIFSLPGERTISERGAHFRLPSGRRHLLTPESSIETQQAIGSDIMMALDVCLESSSDEATTRAGMATTHAWAQRSLEAHTARQTGQALFGIVQGGVHTLLREESAAAISALPFDGFAIGGLAVGETRAQREGMTALCTRLLPENKPRYLMGVGTPLDLLEAVHRGVDLFDCILPTENGAARLGVHLPGRAGNTAPGHATRSRSTGTGLPMSRVPHAVARLHPASAPRPTLAGRPLAGHSQHPPHATPDGTFARSHPERQLGFGLRGAARAFDVAHQGATEWRVMATSSW